VRRADGKLIGRRFAVLDDDIENVCSLYQPFLLERMGAQVVGARRPRAARESRYAVKAGQ
jgi:hypothetical protein